jgi:hypothetical protein
MSMLRVVSICLTAMLWCTSAAVRAADSAEILVQVSLAAGLRYHEAKTVWDQMQAGDTLTLVREPGNPFDARAVRVEWNGHMLGYIPRTDNQAVARQMDRGNPLQARIARLTYYRNHRRKLEFEVFLPLQPVNGN